MNRPIFLFGIRRALFSGLGILLLTCATLRAELTRFEIFERNDFAGGEAFGETGAYQRIRGRVYYELDPDLTANRNVVDLKLAPRNERGRVELSADLFILAPKDLAKGNRAMLYGVNNRGGVNTLRHFNYAAGSSAPETSAHAGDGFLMRHGFTLVWSGWDGELLPDRNRLRLFPPGVESREKPITGLVRCEIVPGADTRRTVINWANHGSYRPTAAGLESATLTERILPGHPRVEIPREKWKLIVTEVESDNPNQLPKVELEYPDTLKRKHIYEVIYEAQDPVVMGAGFCAVRDLVSALKHGTGADNPLLVEEKPVIERAHGFGVSQSGRFLREFVYWDFNADEAGRQVFDGIIPHVSGSGMGSFNHRFAQPTRHAGQHDHHDYPPDRFPFAYETQTDPLSGQTEGILRRSLESGTAPLVFHTQSASEYWNRSGSLVHTDPLGQVDGKIPDTVRLYFFGGTQHGPAAFTTEAGAGQTAPSSADYKPFVRALLLALDRWAKDGTEPPPGMYPKIADGELVAWTQNATGFPEIPGIQYPGVIQQPSFLDFGLRWQEQGIVDRQPPLPRGDYRVRVPRSGPDGNDLGCLAAPEVAVPIGSYPGWRLLKPDAPAANQLFSLSGSYIPFPLTREEREKAGDPRKSLEERYGSLEEYLEKLEAQCRKYEAEGYLLPEDTERTLRIQRERVKPLFDALEKGAAAANAEPSSKD
ncbi:MAG: alpha/beta hydrolase domain-containing protein [Verrucomicrobiales bacterium]|nr:alpha/beta hydrolase domain-containing protein [Verrucomicrobiales bacterium]